MHILSVVDCGYPIGSWQTETPPLPRCKCFHIIIDSVTRCLLLTALVDVLYSKGVAQ